MSARFGPDSSLHQVLSWIAALVLANLMCVAFFVPLATSGIGILVTTLVSLRLIESESTAILPAVRLALKGSWLSSSLLFLAETGLGILLSWEWIVVSNLANSTARLFARALILSVALVLLVVHVWVWPMMAYRLEEKGKVEVFSLPSLVKAAFLVGVVKLPRAILALLVIAAPLALTTVSLGWAIRVLFWFLAFGIAFSSYVIVLASRPVLAPALGKDSDLSSGEETPI